MDEIDKLYVSLGLGSTLSEDITAAEQDFDRLEREASQTADKMIADYQRVGDSMKQMGKNLTLWVTTPLMAFGALSVKAAGDAAETQSKFEQVFQGMTADAEMWAEGYGDAVGRATTDLEDMLATTMSIVKAMGMGYSEGTAFSETITQLAVDMASFNNSADSEAFTALRSAITGEYEAMKRFGVVVNEAKVEQELLNMGIKGGTTAASDAEKAQARLNVILAATADTQGDAERTADSFSNQLKALQADTTEMAETVGEDLLPIAQSGIDILRQLIDRFESLGDTTQTAIIATAGFTAALGPAVWVAGSMVSSIGQLRLAIDAYKASTFAATLATRGFSAALLATPATAAALGIGAVVTGLALLDWQASQTNIEMADFNEALAYSGDQLRDMAADLREPREGLELLMLSMGAALQDFTTLGAKFGQFNVGVSEAMRSANADVYEHAAVTRDAMDAIQQELSAADRAYSEHQRTISDLTKEYDTLRAAIDRAMDLPEDISDQNRAIESAEIAMERAAENLARLQMDPTASALDLREADLQISEAKDRWLDAKTRLSELETEQSDILGGQTIEQAQDRLKDLDRQKNDEKIALEQSLTERNELQKVYDAVNTQDQIDAHEALQKYFDEHPTLIETYHLDRGVIYSGENVTADLPSRPAIDLVGEAGSEAIAPLRLNNSSTSNEGDTFYNTFTINVGSVNDIAPALSQSQDVAEILRSRRIQRGIR